jgi:hypothetical protein
MNWGQDVDLRGSHDEKAYLIIAAMEYKSLVYTSNCYS